MIHINLNIVDRQNINSKFKLLILVLSILLGGSAKAQLPPTEDPAHYPGYTDPSHFPNTCFDFMGAVDFTSGYRFITSYTGTPKPTGWTGEKLNPDTRRMVGFSIPYVADLNGDGYPEIIGIGQTDGGSSLYGVYRYVYIYNGRTGKEISRLPFVTATNNEVYFSTTIGYHVSPSIAALVDSDRDGTVEIICAFPRTGTGTNNATLESRVVSYNIVPSGTGEATTYSLQFRSAAADKYIRNVSAGTDADNEYQRPIVQVCDLNGDGKAEVLVYNKVYDASTLELLVEMESIATNTTSASPAFMGCNVNAYGGETYRDRYIAGSYIYDINLDGIYDVIAGGKVYLMKENPVTKKVELDRIIQMPGVEDGYTGVADINGDGIADIVVVNRPNRASLADIAITVWNPNFDASGNATPALIAPVRNIKTEGGGTDAAQGTNSYVYIGDIDGRVQEVGGKKYRLPEIAILTRRIDVSQFTQHSNIKDIAEADGGIPSTYNWNTPRPSTSARPDVQGCIFAVTFDVAQNDLRGSFMMEHFDMSINTGFTMFDFDNDGVDEICYRDEGSLRIIKPKIPFIRGNFVNKRGDGGTTNQNNDVERPDIILFSKRVQSFTGFEYPVIADIDNDASAEMVVVGHQDGAAAFGYIYALGSTGDKFAPALPVWNQFMYDPFKINPDLTTPIGLAPNRLKTTYNFKRLIKNADGTVREVVEEYRPYNNTLTQMSKYELRTEVHNGVTYPNLFEPIVFLTEFYVVSEKDPDISKRPKMVIESPTKSYIEVYIGNRATAKTDISLTTPISVYKGNAVGKGTFVKKIHLNDNDVILNGLTSGKDVIRAGEEVVLRIPVTDPYGSYIIRLGDDSDLTSDPVAWRFGLNYRDEATGSAINDLVNKEGTSSRAFRDCNWGDQVAKAAFLVAVDDTHTLQEYKSVEFLGDDLRNNDKLPTPAEGTFESIGLVSSVVVDGQPVDLSPKAGTVTFENNKFIYKHNKNSDLPYGVDNFTYEVSYKITATNQIVSSMAKVYIFILEDNADGLAVCYNDNHTIRLKNYDYTVDPSPSDPDPQPQPDVDYYWHTAGGVAIPGNPQSNITINAITADVVHQIKPVFKNHRTYAELDFPKGELTVSVIGQSANDVEKLVWTGVVDNNWSNPNNWKNEADNISTFAPSTCVDVHIPQVAKPNDYPTLGDAQEINNFSLGDRALIKNLNKLTYKDGSIDLKIKATELNKWLMLAPAMEGMVAGDLMPLDNAGQPIYKHTYINLKEATAGQANVYGAMVSQANMSVAKTMPYLLYIDGSDLPSSNAYTIKLPAVSTTNRYTSYDKILNHPIGFTESEVVSQAFGITPAQRTNNNKFTATGLADDFEFYPVVTDGVKYVLVVNPYPAYLNLRLLFAANTDFEPDRYKVWNGSDDFLVRESYYNKSGGESLFKFGGDDTVLDGLSTTISGGANVYIAPFQSFFIKMKTQNSAPKVVLNNSMTATKLDNGVEDGGYSYVK